MHYSHRYTIACAYILALCLVFSFNVKTAQADDARASLRFEVPEDSGITAIVKSTSANEPAADNNITWSNVSAGDGWKIADQYIEISYDPTLPEFWGLQIYTDNKNKEADPRYTGTGSPAGMVKVGNTIFSLPMIWLIKDTPILPNEPVERPDKLGFESYNWHYFKDKSNVDLPHTPFDESFENAEDYVVLWNQSGIAWNEGARSGKPATAYVYLAANFIMASVNSQYTTNTLTIETYKGVSPFPFYVYKDGAHPADLAYQYIYQKMDKYFNGRKLRLIESYSHPADYNAIFAQLPSDDPLRIKADELSRKAFTYDNCLAICALLANPSDTNLGRAETLCKSLIWAQSNIDGDGRFRDAYDAGEELTIGYTQPDYGEFTSSNSGNIAWAIIALMQYYNNPGTIDAAFKNKALQAAISAGEFLHNNFYDKDQAGYYYGYDENGQLDKSKSTENNIAIYVAFSCLYDVTEQQAWLTRANGAKNFVENIAKQPAEHRFICGLNADGTRNEDALVADCNLLAILGGMTGAETEQYLDYITDNFFTTYFTGDQDAPYTDDENFIGIDFGYSDGQADEPDGAWFEGTAQLASVCQLLETTGEHQIASKYLKSIELAQHSALYADYKGITAASDKITTGLGYSYYPFPHIGATSWYIAAKRNYNMLWATPLSGEALAVAKYPVEYLKNHYIPSGRMWNQWAGPIFTDSRYPNPTQEDPDNTCFRIHIGSDWRGIVWQEPEGTWGDHAGPSIGYDLRGATKLKFKAKASRNINDVQINIGYDEDSCGRIPPWDFDDFEYMVEHLYYDLTTDWQDFVIDIDAIWGHYNPGEPLDMSHVANGFAIVFRGANLDIYLDDIKYEQE